MQKKAKSLIDYLFLISLSTFTIYAFYACRPNPIFSSPSPYSPAHPEPALCQSLSTYRTHILEPYVLPPVRHALSYTHKATKPYVAQAQAQIVPHLAPVQKAVDTVRPYAELTARATKTVWTGTLVPIYKATLKPYYDTAVVPRYKRYIHPHLVPLSAKMEKYFAHYISNPLRAQANIVLSKFHSLYILHLDPHVRTVKPHVRRAYRTTSQVAGNSWQFYVTQFQPRILDTWIAARPVLCAGWKQTKTFSVHAFDITSALLKKAAQEAGVYRRAYVDPHLDRILEKVTETNGLEGEIPVTSAPEQAPLADELPDTPVQEPATVESIFEPTSVGSPTTVPVPTTADVADNTLFAEPAVPTPEEGATNNVTGVAETELEPPAETIPEVDEQPKTAEVEAADPTPEAVPSPASVVGVGATSSGHPEDEEDMDEFLKELEADKPKDNETPAVEESDAPKPPSPEEEEARLVAIAQKRAEITRRHNVWFGTLEALTIGRSKELVAALEKIRMAATRRVYEMISVSKKSKKKQNTPEKNAEDGTTLADVQRDGERLVRGLEGWLKKAEGRSIDWKVSKDAVKADDEDMKRLKQSLISREKDKWTHVIGKVEEKFTERVQTFQEEVHNWYVGIREQEAQEVLKSGADVKSMAEEAQGDLGLDYAWLDDVTYNDWQKYHDLMRSSCFHFFSCLT